MDYGFYDYSFEGVIDRFGVGRARKIWYSVLFLPADLEGVLPFARYPRLRVDGEIADIPISGAWIPTGDGRRYIIVAPRVFQDAGVRVGSLVEMRFRIADQDAVDMPEALSTALSLDPAAANAWSDLTPGKKRGFAHIVHGAKTDPTRTRRVAEVIAALKRDSID